MVRKQFLVDGRQVKRTLIGLSTGVKNNGANCTGYNFLHSVDVGCLVMNGVFVIDSRTGIVYQGRKFSTTEYTFRRNCDGDICIKYDIPFQRNRRSFQDAFGRDAEEGSVPKLLKRQRTDDSPLKRKRRTLHDALGRDAEEIRIPKVLKRQRTDDSPLKRKRRTIHDTLGRDSEDGWIPKVLKRQCKNDDS